MFIGGIFKKMSFFLYSWCKILRVQKLQQSLVVVVNGLTEENYNRLKQTESFEKWKQLFTSVGENFLERTKAR